MDFDDDEEIRRSSLMAFDAAEDSEYFHERFTASRFEPCDAVSEIEADPLVDITGNHSPIVYQSPVGSPDKNLPSPVHSLYSNNNNKKPELLKSTTQPHLWVFPTSRQSASKLSTTKQSPGNESSLSQRSFRGLVKSNSTPSLIIASPRIKKTPSQSIMQPADQIIVNLRNSTFKRNNNNNHHDEMETIIDPDKPFLIITEGDFTFDQRTIRLLNPNAPFPHAYLNPNRNIILDFLTQNHFQLVSDYELICVRGQKLRDLYFLLQNNTKKLSIGRMGYNGKELQLWPLISQLKVLEEDSINF